MGRIADTPPEPLQLPPYQTYTPLFVRGKNKNNSNNISQLRETILQSLIRQHLSRPEVFNRFLLSLGLDQFTDTKFEVLGERALEEGHVDLLIKEIAPKGAIKQIIIETKLGRATSEHVEQLQKYVNELGSECIAGVLIAETTPQKRLHVDNNIRLARYTFETDTRKPNTFETLLSALRINVSAVLV